MRKLIVIAGIIAISALGVLGLTGTANAGTTNSVITKPTTSYTSPSDQSGRVQLLTPGTHVESVCFTEGQTLRDNPYWFRVVKDGEAGYVHRDTISGVPADLRHC